MSCHQKLAQQNPISVEEVMGMAAGLITESNGFPRFQRPENVDTEFRNMLEAYEAGENSKAKKHGRAVIGGLKKLLTAYFLNSPNHYDRELDRQWGAGFDEGIVDKCDEQLQAYKAEVDRWKQLLQDPQTEPDIPGFRNWQTSIHSWIFGWAPAEQAKIEAKRLAEEKARIQAERSAEEERVRARKADQAKRRIALVKNLRLALYEKPGQGPADEETEAA